MALINRVKGILLTPKEEWIAIGQEEKSIPSIILQYLLPLALIQVLSIFIGLSFFSGSLGISYGLYYAIIIFVQLVATICLNALIADALAPTFKSEKNFSRSIRLMIYAGTPVYVGSLLSIIPIIGWLGALAGGIYSIYLLFVGLPILKKTPRDMTAGYLVILIISLLVLYFLLQAILVRVFLGGFFTLGTGI